MLSSPVPNIDDHPPVYVHITDTRGILVLQCANCPTIILLKKQFTMDAFALTVAQAAVKGGLAAIASGSIDMNGPSNFPAAAEHLSGGAAGPANEGSDEESFPEDGEKDASFP